MLDLDYFEEPPVEQGVEVPYSQLSADALDGLLESFIGRDGTDYGEVEQSLEQKKGQLKGALERDEAVIVFEPSSESFTIRSRSELRK